MERMKRILPILLSVGLLGAVIYFSDARSVASALRSADMRFVAAGLTLWAVGVALRIERWNALLKHVRIVLPFRDVATTFLAGFYLSNITPGKAGDPIRAVMLKRTQGVSFSQALPSIIIERMADLLAMMSIASVGILFLPPVIPKRYVYGIVAVFATILFVIVLAVSSQRRAQTFLRIVHRVFSFVPKIRSLESRIGSSSVKITESFASYRSPRVLAKTFAITAVLWFLEGGIGVLAFKAIGVDVPYLWVLTMVPIATLAGVLSLLPGGIGSSELVGVVFFVTVLGITPAQATAAALLARLMSYWMYVLAGSLSMGVMKRI
ncbi:MAG: flippase-like domain-containing protein [Candidatus Aenigmarchaeota archaeon]|nr:flippase-like domain-containing protein [Candidatus Aenigmarchaeota archaeon]